MLTPQQRANRKQYEALKARRAAGYRTIEFSPDDIKRIDALTNERNNRTQVLMIGLGLLEDSK